MVSNTVISYGLLMTHRAAGLSALFQSPAVKEVLKDQDGRKGLIAAICAGKVCENKLRTAVGTPHMLKKLAKYIMLSGKSSTTSLSDNIVFVSGFFFASITNR